MYFIMDGHAFFNEVQTVIQIFYPLEKYILVNSVQEKGITVISGLKNGVCAAAIYKDGKLTAEKSESAGINEKLSSARVLFKTLKKVENIETPWGMMTGIRPTKKIYELLVNHTKEEVVKIMNEVYLISEDKLRLLFDAVETQKEMKLGGGASLYIGIPFCPTRCLYCSFMSSVYRDDKIKPYLDALYRELDFLSRYKTPLKSVYIGGGTPTSLKEDEIKSLLHEVNRLFQIDETVEFTVEGGRPDTLDVPKLSLLKDYNVTRISVNPQTLSSETLQRIGRAHTPDDFIRAFQAARETGHGNVNVDIILGLPGETADDVERTLNGISELAPESLTVHTLAVKRASKLKENFEEYGLAPMDEMKKTLELSERRAREMGMRPYYLYRQKNMTGNLENVGYAKKGYECAYNVLIMEETQTILAAGAGAVTKTVDADRIERSFNVKNVDEYINRIDEMIERKRGFLNDTSS